MVYTVINSFQRLDICFASMLKNGTSQTRQVSNNSLTFSHFFKHSFSSGIESFSNGVPANCDIIGNDLVAAAAGGPYTTYQRHRLSFLLSRTGIDMLALSGNIWQQHRYRGRSRLLASLFTVVETTFIIPTPPTYNRHRAVRQ